MTVSDGVTITYTKVIRASYVVKMIQLNSTENQKPFYKFFVQSSNGVRILNSKFFTNKAQCRNTGKKFANIQDMDWRE